MNNPLLDFLRADGSIVVNKKLIHAIGLHEAILYSELVSKHFYFAEKGQLEGGYFYNVSENLKRDTGLSAKQQKLAIDNLVNLGLISTQIRGVPARKFFKIEQNLVKLAEIMSTDKKNQQFGKKVETSIAERLKLVEQKGNGNNTNTILKNNTKDYILLTQDDDSFISYYLSVYCEYMQDPHPTLTYGNYYKLMEFIGMVKEFNEYDDWCDAVDDHFANLPETNNGSIVAFMYSSFKYFEINMMY